jgi:carboxymethylenebutenolidase
MGGADQATSAEDVAAFDAALAKAGVDHEIVTYEGAPHSFFDRKQDEFVDASADAWSRVLGFIAGHAAAATVG